MAPAPIANGRRRTYRRRAIALYLVAVCVMVSTLAWVLIDQYRRDLEDGKADLQARADLVAEWVAGYFALSEHSLNGMVQWLQVSSSEGGDEASFSPRQLAAYLAGRRDSIDFVNELSHVDSQGRVVASSNSVLPSGFDVSELPFFRPFQQDSDRQETVTPLYWSSLSQAFRVVHARRLEGSDGTFQGVVLSQLDPSIFSEALDRLSMTAGESLAILDSEMQLVARRPAFDTDATDGVLGMQVEEPLTHAFIESGEMSTSVRVPSPLDGVERLYWMQRVAELPYAVVVGAETEVLLSGWHERARGLSGLALLVALLGGVAVRHYFSRLDMESALHQRLLERERAQREVQERESRLAALVSSIQDMIFVFDAAGRFVYIHAPDHRQLMLEPGEVLNRHYRDVLPPFMSKPLEKAFTTLQTDDQPLEYDYQLTLDGQVRDYHAVVSPLAEHGDSFSGVLALVRDVTQTRATEAQLRIAATAFETHLGMMITDAEGAILKVNDTFSRITGYSEEEVLGQHPRLLWSDRHDERFYERLWASVKGQGSWQGEIWNRRRNGEVFPEWMTISAVNDESGELTHLVATFSDISERKAAEEEIHQLAFFDSLTGLANRRQLQDHLDAALRESRRSDQYTALLFIDIDNFKQVNDTLGHHQGDRLLQHVAKRLDQVLRNTDTLARIGGDEFAVLLRGLGTDQDRAASIAERVANKLLMVLPSPCWLDGESVKVTGSIGITLCHGQDADGSVLFQQADMALFQAKDSGRDTLSFFDPGVQARLQERAGLENDLRQALARREFQLHYQVQVDAVGNVTGVEALLRWPHPVRGWVSPADFIPLAETNRLIIEIGDWVLETACRQLAVWAQDPATAGLSLSVNVSPEQFREPGFVARVTSLLEESGAPPERLELEVTESLFVEHPEEARETMQRLKARGVTFALDDYGTGYSSLAYLKRLPLDKLKIDQSFVRDLLEDEASAAIIASTIALSHSLKLAVIAEGVETPAQRDWLVAHGCEHYQGFLFGRPMPVNALDLSRR
ncbi:diguanylate cyclase/phosphodiesterase with PAS/PAC sensor(s) [Billgrantia gudaonensis]|uniref:cyclic-guanylate-specific phosphodiesterase n=1 Tax=Billgrantia gudaonensis TaxID=376427 RepID=A0A1G8R615_9GAMM|nr:diguanylate cyclase/phosphodiesterase with PAS/PAC sensor(s) [Halomonas gudaonensis]